MLLPLTAKNSRSLIKCHSSVDFLWNVLVFYTYLPTSLSAQENTAAFTMASKTIQIDGKPVSIPTGLFINGEFVAAHGGGEFTVENPATGETVISVQEGKAEDVDLAVRAARKTFNDPAWREMPPPQRGAFLNKLADLMEEHLEELIAIEMLDTGKTYKQASTLDVPASIGTLRYYAGWADKVLGVASFNIPKVFGFTRREPIGVCGQIIPWKYVDFFNGRMLPFNFPLLLRRALVSRFSCSHGR